MTLTWLALVLTEVTHDRYHAVAGIMVGLGVLLLFFGFWMWAFMLPRRWAPPRWRDQHGWVPTLWCQFRGKPTYDQSTQRGKHER